MSTPGMRATHDGPAGEAAGGGAGGDVAAGHRPAGGGREGPTAVGGQPVTVDLPDGGRLAGWHWPGAARPFLLVHGLASNARLWDATAVALAAAGHEVLSVDLRGHGRSSAAPAGYGTPEAARDLADLLTARPFAVTPLLAGQSWGGNVAVELAACHGGVAGLALVDGGWIHLARLYPTFAACWERLAPPQPTDASLDAVARRVAAAHPDWPAASIDGVLACYTDEGGRVRARLDRAAHRTILASLYHLDPATRWPAVSVPTVLLVAGATAEAWSEQIEEAAAALPSARVAWYEGGHHDLHAEQPARVAADLVALARRVQGPPSERTVR